MSKPSALSSARLEFANTAIDQALAILAVPYVQDALGKTRVSVLSRVLDSNLLAVANVASTYTLPKTLVDTDKVPVLAVRPESEITVRGLGMTVFQRNKAVTFWAGKLDDAPAAEDHVARVHNTYTDATWIDHPDSVNKSSGGTTVGSKLIAKAVMPEFATRARPYVLLHYSPASQSSAPFTILHEAGHVARNLGNPVTTAGKDPVGDVQEEFSSYSDIYDVLSGLKKSGIKLPADEAFVKAAAIVDEVMVIKNNAMNWRHKMRITPKIVKQMAYFIDNA